MDTSGLNFLLHSKISPDSSFFPFPPGPSSGFPFELTSFFFIRENSIWTLKKYISFIFPLAFLSLQTSVFIRMRILSRELSGHREMFIFEPSISNSFFLFDPFPIDLEIPA